MAIRGGNITLAAGKQAYTSAIEITQDNAVTTGSGPGTLVQRNFNTGTTQGFINVAANDVMLQNMVIDGNVTSPTGLIYTTDFSLPTDDPLIKNSSVWVHGGTKRLVIQNCTIQNTGGYAIILDARTTDIEDVIIHNCKFINNSPHLFGTSSALYGSWTGGIFFLNNGTTGGAVKNLTVDNCSWMNCSGNGMWGWSQDFTINHQQILLQNSTMTGQGLDGVEFGNVVGGGVVGCSFYQIGYIAGAPKFDPGGKCASGIDSTGFVRNVTYSNNTLKSVNGHFMDLDGLHDSTVSDNALIIPDSSTADFTADQIASYGYSGSGNISIGINTGNTYYKLGGSNLNITGNTIRNMGYWAIACSNLKDSIVAHNNIVHVSTNANPILLFCKEGYDNGVLTDGNGSTGTTADKDYYRSHGNIITDNRIDYNQANFCIAEADIAGQTFVSTDINQVYGNKITGANYGEFLKDTNSGSFSGLVLNTNDAAATAPDHTRIQREGHGTGASTKTYKSIAGTQTQISQLSDASFLNLSVGGASGTGALATGNRSTLAWPDAVGTSKVAADGFISITDTTFVAADANLLDATYVLLRRSGSNLQISTSVTSGVRNWTTVSTSGEPFPDNTALIANSSDATKKIILDASLVSTATTRTLKAQDASYTIAGVDVGNIFTVNQTLKGTGVTLICENSSASIGVELFCSASNGGTFKMFDGSGTTTFCQIDSVNGILLQNATRLNITTSTLSDAVAVPNGGVTALSLVSIRNDGASGVTISRSSATARTWGFAVESSGKLALNDDTGSHIRMEVDTSGIFYFGGSNLEIDQSGNLSCIGVVTATGSSAGVAVVTSTAFNSIKSVNGGMYAATGFTSDQAFYPKGYASSASLNTPGAGYSGIAWKSGSQFWYYNAGWSTVDFSSVGGGVTSLSASTGISVSGSTGAVTVTNTGVTSLGSQTGALNLSAGTGVTLSGTGSLTINIGQSVATSATPTFAEVLASNTGTNFTFANNNSNFLVNGNGAVTCSGVITSTSGMNVTTTTATNSIQTSGGFNAGSTGSGNGVFQVNGTTVINSSRVFVGAGALCGSSGIGAGAFNPWNGSGYDTGATGTITIAGLTSITVRGGSVIGWT